MRTVTATTTKGGGEGWYNDGAVYGENCDKEGNEEVGNDHGGEENNNKKKTPPPPAGW